MRTLSPIALSPPWIRAMTRKKPVAPAPAAYQTTGGPNSSNNPSSSDLPNSATGHDTTAFTLAMGAQRKLQSRRRNNARGSRHGGSRAATTCGQRLSATQRRGLQAESRAIAWLSARGLILLARNLCCRYGELDAVFRADDNTMVIVEIRYRCSDRHGGAAASISRAKQQRLRRTATWFLPQLTAMAFGGRTPRCRFDAVCIEGDTVNWLPAVF